MKKLQNFLAIGRVISNDGRAYSFYTPAGNAIMLPKWAIENREETVNWIELDIQTDESCNELEIIKLNQEILILHQKLLREQQINFDLRKVTHAQREFIEKKNIPFWKRRKEREDK